MNKKGTISSGLVAIVVISTLLIAVGFIIDGWADPYGSGLTSDFEAYNKLDDITNDAESQKGRINPDSGEASSDFETDTFRGAYGIMTNIFSSFRVVFGSDGMINSITDRFGIPSYVGQMVVSIMIIVITFSLIAIIFRLARTKA